MKTITETKYENALKSLMNSADIVEQKLLENYFDIDDKSREEVNKILSGLRIASLFAFRVLRRADKI